MNDLTGKKIYQYKLLEKTGGGGMGVVYKARDEKLERVVALKFLPPQFVADEETEKRFMLEARSASSLDHPNICTIYEINKTDDGQLFIVMAFYDGETLKKKISRGALPYNEVINISAQIASGLERAHKGGIIHRDVKPANIMITEFGEVKIVDFGLAKTKASAGMTKFGSTVGTAAYMSPEQSRGEAVDQRTDIWALGIIIYEMITGNNPFKGEYEQAIIYSILNDELPEINGIPEQLRNIIRKSTAKNPDDRYRNINEMYQDLLMLKGDSDSHKSVLQVNTEKRISPSNKKWIWIGASLMMILILAVLGYFFTSKDATSNSSRKIIVVLPFENLGSQDDKYFADGVTDEITSKLATVGNIGVISRESAQKLASSNKSQQEMGKEFGVNYILSGTIRWAKGTDQKSRVRITPQLTRVSDNTITWSDSYDKILDDIFSVQNDIAQKVVDQLGGSILKDHIQKSIPTSNLEAYDFYLKGLSYEARSAYIQEDFVNSTNLFKKAVELDPGFALAYAHLSKSQASMYWFYYDRSKKIVMDAYENAQKAYQLNPDLADSHLALGYYYYWCNLDYEKAIKEFFRALEIQPNCAEAFFGLGIVYRRMGNFELSIKNMLKGQALDPLAIEYGRNLGETYGLVKDFDNATKAYKKVLELNPDMDLAKAELASNYIFLKGDTKTAARIMNEIRDDEYLDIIYNIPVYCSILDRNFENAEKEMKSSKRPFETGQFQYTPKTLILGLIYKYKNEPEMSKVYFDSSKVELEELVRKEPQDERYHSSLGITYAALGMNDKALAEGEKGIELMPLEKEAYRGFYRQWDLAKIYTLIEDYNNALKQIDFILSKPGTFTINILMKDPLYDPLRNLPGYKAIVQKYSDK
ncbi:MAG TPA: protein kinase [Ignavibacteriaceae bacterium]|nr:protein kinase [Ignavibacteriaceae bacterium]